MDIFIAFKPKNYMDSIIWTAESQNALKTREDYAHHSYHIYEDMKILAMLLTCQKSN